jgi:hypothetical protein
MDYGHRGGLVASLEQYSPSADCSSGLEVTVYADRAALKRYVVPLLGYNGIQMTSGDRWYTKGSLRVSIRKNVMTVYDTRVACSTLPAVKKAVARL